MYCFCPNCKNIFFLDIPMLGQMTFTNSNTKCIICDYDQSQILDGTWSFDENRVVTLLSGPAFTVEVLQKMNSLFEKAKLNNYSADEIIKEGKRINSAVGLFLEFLNKNIGLLTLLGLLPVTLSAILSSSSQTTIINNITINNNQIKVEKKLSDSRSNVTYPSPRKKRRQKR